MMHITPLRKPDCLILAIALSMFFSNYLFAEPLPLHSVWTSAYSRANSSETQILALRPGSDRSAYLWMRTHPDTGGKEGTIVKMNTRGETLWELHLGHPSASNAYPADISVQDARVLVCLSLELTNSVMGIMTASISMDGQLEWSHVYTGGVSAAAYSICQDSTGGVAVAGSHENDSLLIKLDGDGNLQWVQVRDGPHGGNNLWLQVRPGLHGDVYTRGHTYVPAGSGVFDHLAYHSATGGVNWQLTPTTYSSAFLVTDSGGNAYIDNAPSVYKLDAMGRTLWSVNATGGPALLMQLTSDEQGLFYAGELRVSGKFRYHMSRLSTTGAVEWARVMYNEINPPDSWQPYAAAVDPSGFSYVSGNRGLFLFAPDGNQYLKIPGYYRHLAAVGHNELFAGLSPASIEYLSGFPAFSEDHFRFYGAEGEISPDEIRCWAPSKPGQSLRVEFTGDLMTPGWTELPPILSTGLITEVVLPLTNASAFYRLRADP